MTTVCLSFDFDGMAIWLSTFKQMTPTPLSRGEYGARVGVDRVLEVLRSHAAPATFFVPVHTARSFPEAVERIVAAGHEIASHGFVHESPVGMDVAEEAELLQKSQETLLHLTGSRPIGYRSPAWDLSPNTIELLQEHGYIYDSSLMADDFRVYRPRKRDLVNEHGLVRGPHSTLVEFPVAWELDDYPYFHFASKPLNQGLRSVEDVFSLWKAEFDFCHEQVQGGVFTLTLHPEIIGRGPRVRLLSRLLDHMQQAQGVRFSTMGRHAAAVANTLAEPEANSITSTELRRG